MRVLIGNAERATILSASVRTPGIIGMPFGPTCCCGTLRLAVAAGVAIELAQTSRADLPWYPLTGCGGARATKFRAPAQPRGIARPIGFVSPVNGLNVPITLPKLAGVFDRLQARLLAAVRLLLRQRELTIRIALQACLASATREAEIALDLSDGYSACRRRERVPCNIALYTVGRFLERRIARRTHQRHGHCPQHVAPAAARTVLVRHAAQAAQSANGLRPAAAREQAAEQTRKRASTWAERNQ